MNKLLNTLGLTVLFFVSLAITIWINGITVFYLWSWFVHPYFDVPQLSRIQAAGITLLVRYMATGLNRDKNTDDESMGEKLLHGLILAVLYSLFILLIGYILHLL